MEYNYLYLQFIMKICLGKKKTLYCSDITARTVLVVFTGEVVIVSALRERGELNEGCG